MSVQITLPVKTTESQGVVRVVKRRVARPYNNKLCKRLYANALISISGGLLAYAILYWMLAVALPTPAAESLTANATASDDAAFANATANVSLANATAENAKWRARFKECVENNATDSDDKKNVDVGVLLIAHFAIFTFIVFICAVIIFAPHPQDVLLAWFYTSVTLSMLLMMLPPPNSKRTTTFRLALSIAYMSVMLTGFACMLIGSYRSRGLTLSKMVRYMCEGPQEDPAKATYVVQLVTPPAPQPDTA